MVGLPGDLKFPFDQQQQFEKALVDNEINNDDVLNIDYLRTEYGLSDYQAQVILDCAYRKGLLEQVSAGSFSRKEPSQPEIISVFQHAEKTGMKPISIVRSVELVPASASVAEKLALQEGAPIYQQRRSRLINDVVVANQTNSIPYCVTPDLESLDLKHRSFQVVLENKYHAVVHAIKEAFALAESTEEDREILGLADGEQVLLVQRLSLSANDRPLVWADIHVNPHHFQLVESLWPEAAKFVK